MPVRDPVTLAITRQALALAQRDLSEERASRIVAERERDGWREAHAALARRMHQMEVACSASCS